MLFNDQLLIRLNQDRARNLAAEAARWNSLAATRVGWRRRVARSLIALAQRLEASDESLPARDEPLPAGEQRSSPARLG